VLNSSRGCSQQRQLCENHEFLLHMAICVPGISNTTGGAARTQDGNEVTEPYWLPPGFRFHPTDEELVTYYLARKLMSADFKTHAISEVDLNKCEPWDLPGMSRAPHLKFSSFSRQSVSKFLQFKRKSLQLILHPSRSALLHEFMSITCHNCKSCENISCNGRMQSLINSHTSHSDPDENYVQIQFGDLLACREIDYRRERVVLLQSEGSQVPYRDANQPGH
jgi:hypothetical protein